MPKARYQKDEKGLYYVCVPTNEFRTDGYRKYKRLRAKSQVELDKKLEEYNDSISNGVVPGRRYTVNQWYEIWLAQYKGSCSVNTRNFYKSLYTNHIKPAIGNTQITDVLEVHAQGILNTTAETHSKKTVKDVRSVLFSLFQTAHRNKLIKYNPCADLDVIGGTRAKERRSLTQEERTAFLDAIPGHPFGTFAALLYFFGLRRGEALALTGSDIMEDYIIVKKQIVYPTNNAPILQLMPKTDAGVRDIPIPDKARQYIDFDNLPSGLLFANEEGKPLSYSQMIDRWHKFLKDALGDDTDITMHYLRHNYCTMLFEAEVDLLDVKRYAGHEDINTTLRIYTHYTESLKRKAAKKVLSIG